MPIYEYRCQACGAQLEKRQRFSDPPLSTCPSCGAEALKKLVSRTAFALKGDGWFKDHYGLKQGASEGGASEGGASAGGATEPAPAAAPATPAAPAAPAPSAPPASAAPKPSAGE